MSATLCVGCQSLDLEFFVGEDGSSSQASDDTDSFEVIRSDSYNTSLTQLEEAALVGCELCGIIFRRIRDAPGVSEEDSKVIIVKVFDRYHQLAVHFREHVFYLPIYSDALTGCDDGMLRSPDYPVEQTTNPLDYCVPPQDVHPLESTATMRLAASWLAECDQLHGCTHKSGTIPVYFPQAIPTRVIDVGAHHDPNVRLIVTTDAIDSYRGHRYVTLSHCWGSETNAHHTATTTRANISARKHKIELSGLPKTFQDAILITRELKLRFLWIDSLCIVQDDLIDMDRECAEMSNIYSYSYCTIAASDSVDGSGGCFKQFKTSSISTCSFRCRSINNTRSAEITIYRGFNDWISALNGPLQKRGWALQERHLSPRILHFTNLRLLFECREWYSSADRPHMELKKSREYQNQGALRLVRILDKASDNSLLFGNGTFNHSKWIKIVEEYSQRSLSFPSDKLPALSGLADWFYQPRGDIYAAGMWSNSFAKDLNWRPGFRVNEQTRERLLSTEYTMPGRGPRIGTERYRTRISGLPTWSWASMDSPIVYLGYDASVPVSSLTVLSFDVALAGVNPYGAIEHAKVKVSGLTTPVYAIQVHGFKNHTEWYQSPAPLASTECSPISFDLAQASRHQFNAVISDTATADTFRSSFYIDATDEEIAPDCPLLCLLTCHMERYYEPEDPDIAGLVLRDAGGGEWARVGTFQTSGQEIRWFREERRLTLV